MDLYETIARTYDGDYAVHRTPGGDVDFYVEEAKRSGGPVLELGCGTGRVLAPIADTGLEITGIDASPAMLSVARSKVARHGARVRLIRGDMVTVEAGGPYALAIIPFRAIGHVHGVQEQRALFRNVLRHLRPDGRFVFDFFHPDFARLAQPIVDKLDVDRVEDGRRIRRYVSVTPHPATQLSDLVMRWEIEGAAGGIEHARSEMTIRWFHRFELEHLLAMTGFSLEALYGDFRRGPLEDRSPEMVFVARPLSWRG